MINNRNLISEEFPGAQNKCNGWKIKQATHMYTHDASFRDGTMRWCITIHDCNACIKSYYIMSKCLAFIFWFHTLIEMLRCILICWLAVMLYHEKYIWIVLSHHKLWGSKFLRDVNFTDDLNLRKIVSCLVNVLRLF